MKVGKSIHKNQTKDKENLKRSVKSIQLNNAGNSENIILFGSTVIALLAFFLYANTLSHAYALDDFPVIYGNSLTMQGMAGIPMMLKTAYWYGLDGQNDFLYRPLSLVTYAIEWQLSPNNPQLGHFTNVLLYAFTGFFLFRLLVMLLKNYNLIIPFITTLVFMVHPLHTEVVANIKSRDELLCFLFFILSAIQFVKYANDAKIGRIIMSGICFFLALLSKESAITFLAFYPLILYFFTGVTWKKNITGSLIMIGVSLIYILIRGSVLTSQTVSGEISVLDNTLMAAPDLQSRLATAFYILGLYLKLLVFPHPLASDYSYPQIPIVTFLNPLALFSLLFYLAAGIYSIIKFTKKSLIVFGIIFYFIPLSLIANVLFLTKSTMADRFLYVPSLGFCLVVAVLLTTWFKLPLAKQNYEKFSLLFTKNKGLMGLTTVILLLFSIKTIARNPDWKNDYSLFSKDSQTSSRSSRIHFLYANHLIQSVKQNLVGEEKKAGYLKTAEIEMNEALKLYPKNFEAIFGLGELYTTTKEYDKALSCYKNAIQYIPGDSKAQNNLGNTYFRMGNYQQAFEVLNNSIRMHPDNMEGYNNIGSVFFATGQYQKAIEVYTKAISLNPKYAEALKNLGSCYGMLKDYDNAIVYFNKAIAVNPNNPDYYNTLAITYQFKGDSLNANIYSEKARQAGLKSANKN